MTASASQAPKNVVLINGLWMTSLSWENWVAHLTRLGFNVIARSWPGMDGDIDDLRRDPSSIAGLGIEQIVAHYEKIINELEQPPIIIGHSFGGLMTQVLLDRGLGAAGVALAPAPIKGVIFLPFSTLKVSLPALSNPLNNHRAVPLTEDQFHYAFGNGLSEEASLKAFERYAVPGPDHVLFQAALANFNPHAATMVNTHNDTRAPLLLVAGGNDHVSPPAVVKATAKLYEHSKAVTEYKEFPNHTHFVLGEEGWSDVADFAINWAVKNARAVA
jgi:pimeloyl-ACP methyl ester carboxylesterase